MPCIAFKPGGALPTLPAGVNFTVPGFSPPTFDAKLCCKIHIPIPVPALPPNPLTANPVFLTAINLVISQVQELPRPARRFRDRLPPGECRMSMQAGSVTVASDASYTGSGLAMALMDAHTLTAEPLLVAQLGGAHIAATPASQTAMKLPVRQSLAAMANAYASALVSYLQANATAHVTSQVLARTPTQSPVPSNANVQPPATAVDIPIT